MRPVILCILLVCASAIPAGAQQLKEITNSIGMKLVLILPGSFNMGSPMEEVGRKVIEKQHLVTISNWFYMGAYEVSQNEYEKVIGKNSSKFRGEKNPVESVAWVDAVFFARRCRNGPTRKRQDERTDYRQKRNGSMQAAQLALCHIVLATRQNRLRSMPGLVKIQKTRHIQSD